MTPCIDYFREIITLPKNWTGGIHKITANPKDIIAAQA